VIITNNYADTDEWFWLWGVIISIGGALVLGFFMGLFRSKGVIRWLLGKLQIQIDNGIPTAWDFKFSKITTPRWVVIDLNDDSSVYGKFGLYSSASSVFEERDIYLEECYTYEEGQQWEPVENSDGILIKWSDIKSIAFFKDEANMKGDETDGKKRRRKSLRLNHKRLPTNKAG
jgi:hypothetical protein